jgi:hypothetical protein
MIDLLLNYWTSLVLLILFVIFLIVMLNRGYTKQVAEILFYLVTEAEKQYGSKTGELKYAAVTTWIYEKTPLIVRILLTRRQIDKLIQIAVVRMKKYLESMSDEARKKIIGEEETKESEAA